MAARQIRVIQHLLDIFAGSGTGDNFLLHKMKRERRICREKLKMQKCTD
jgi:hypothetical protein